MAEEEKNETTENETAEEAAPEAPAEEAAVTEDDVVDQQEPAVAAAEAEAAPAEDDDLADLPWKERRRVLRSRRPHAAGPQLSPEDREQRRRDRRAKLASQRRKRRAAARSQDGAEKQGGGTGTPPAERDSNAAKVREGVVVSDKGDKTITVRIDVARRHRVYEKIVRHSRTLHAHDEKNEASAGDVVRVVETRPISKTKRWRLVDIVEKAR